MTCPWKFFTISRLQTFSFSAHSTRVPSSLQLEYVSAVVLPVEWHEKHFDPPLRNFQTDYERPSGKTGQFLDQSHYCLKTTSPNTTVKTSPKKISRLVSRPVLRPLIRPVSGAVLKPAPRLSKDSSKYRSQGGLETSCSLKTDQYKKPERQLPSNFCLNEGENQPGIRLRTTRFGP